MGEAAYYTKHKEDLELSFYKAIPGKVFTKHNGLIRSLSLSLSVFNFLFYFLFWCWYVNY